MALADKANRYIDDHKPWVMIKDDGKEAEVQLVCTQGLNMFRSLMIYLSPVVPLIARDTREYLNEKTWQWQDAATPLLGVQLPKFKPLLTRVDAEDVRRMVDQSRDSMPVQD